MDASKTLASRSALAVKSDGTQLTITLTVGYPYEITSEEWACPVALHGLHSQIGDIHGIDAWQVVQLAYELLVQLAGHFVQAGGMLYWPETNEPMELDDLLPRAGTNGRNQGILPFQA